LFLVVLFGDLESWFVFNMLSPLKHRRNFLPANCTKLVCFQALLRGQISKITTSSRKTQETVPTYLF
jgi:hypothetical protein